MSLLHLTLVAVAVVTLGFLGACMVWLIIMWATPFHQNT